MKKLACVIALMTVMAAQVFATVDTMRTVYLPVFSQETNTGFAVMAVPVIEVIGIPHLAIPSVLGREYLIPMVGGGTDAMSNINAMAGAAVTIDNFDQIVEGKTVKVSGITVKLTGINSTSNPDFIAVIKEAVAKTFKIDQSKVKIIRN